MTTKDYQQKGMFSIFLSFFKPHRGLFFLDMVCALFVALVDLAYPVISRKAINTLLPNLQYKTFFVVMGIVVLAYVIRSLLYYVITYWGHTFGIRVEADIREALFGHMQTLGFDFYDRNRTGHLMSRLTTDLFEITELAHHGPEDLFIAAVTITGALIVMFTIEWRLALVVCVLIPVAVFVIMSRRRAMGRASRLVKQKVGVINADIESCLSGMRTAKAFANEAVEAEKFRRSNEMYKGSKKYFYQEMGIFNSSMEFFLSILSVAVVTVGGTFLIATHGNIHQMSISKEGLKWGLLAAFGFCMYTLLPERMLKKWGSQPVVGYGMLICGVVYSCIVKVWTIPVHLDFHGILAVAAMVLIGTMMSFLLFLQGVHDIGPVRASMISSVEPVSATLFSVLWLGTVMTTMDLVGMACILVMVIILSVKE